MVLVPSLDSISLSLIRAGISLSHTLNISHTELVKLGSKFLHIIPLSSVLLAATLLLADGVAFCWGQNLRGQLGNNSTTHSFSPVQVISPVLFVNIKAGYTFTCAQPADGTLYCWGYGEFTGNGTASDDLTPVLVGNGMVFTSYTAGQSGVCGTDESYYAYCWGNNMNSELSLSTIANGICCVVGQPIYLVHSPPPKLRMR